MSVYHLAQLNIAKMKYSLDDPAMADFINNLDGINQLAEKSDGFVWRLITDGGVVSQTQTKLFDENTLINLSVWRDVESLHNYVYRTGHAKIMSRRKEWFERVHQAYTVLWWIPVETKPTLIEAKRKLELLRNNGPTAQAFTFKNSYPPAKPSKASESNNLSHC